MYQIRRDNQTTHTHQKNKKKGIKYLHFFEVSSSNSNNKDGQRQVRRFHKGIFGFLEICYYSILRKAVGSQEKGEI